MDKWRILGIEKTKDKDLIKKAYRAKLSKTNPEDDSEGFMRLRNAFEEAMSEADKEDEQEDSFDNELQKKLKEIYMNYSRRIDADEWIELFNGDEFVSLDREEESLDTLLTFMLDYYFVPQYVYKLIVDTFDMESRIDELSERYPRNFLEHIITNSKYKDVINYKLFDEESQRADFREIDRYIDLYYALDNALRERDIEEQKKIIEMLEELPLVHPYLERGKLYHELQIIKKDTPDRKQMLEKYSDELKVLYERMKHVEECSPEDVQILNACGDVLIYCGNYDEAKRYYEHSLELEPEDYTTKGKLAEALLSLGESEQARDIFMELLDINRYDDGARDGMMRANNAIMEKLKAEISENEDNQKAKLKLAWCYYRNMLFGEAIEVLESFSPDEDNKCEYYNLLGREYLYTEVFDKALENFLAWKDYLETIPELEQDEDKQKNKKRYNYVNYFIAESYIGMKDYDEARKYLQIAMSKEHDEIIYSCEALCRVEYESGNYEACVKACENLIERDRENYDAHIYMAKSLYELNQYGEVMEICERAISIYPYFSEPYNIKLEIYWEFEQYDDMRIVIDRYKQYGCISDQISYYESVLFELDDDYGAARDMLLGIVERRGSGETDIKNYFNVYLRLASDCHILGQYDDACKYYDELILLTGDENRDSGRAWLLKLRKRAYVGKAATLSCKRDFEGATKIYESCIDEFGIGGNYIIDYGELLVRMDRFDDCDRFLRKCIGELEELSLIQLCIGNLCCFSANEEHMDKAWEMFELAIKKDPKDYKIYRCMASALLEHGEVEKAKELYEKAYVLDVEHDAYTCGMYLIAIGKTDDVHKPEYQKYIDTATEQLADADDAYTYVKKAEFYRGLKEYQKALAMTDLAEQEGRYPLSCFEENHDVWYERGYIYEELGDYEKSLECFRRALEIFGHNKLYAACVKRLEEKLSYGQSN
ncbi:MAG: tetratricopeptide repeat protein [Wujia sp.]